MPKCSCKIFASLVFALLSLADVTALALGDGALPKFLKPLLMPSLAVAALSSLAAVNRVGKTAVLLFCGLLFHTAGDVLLMLPADTWFLAGLLSFLIGHFFYTAVILRLTWYYWQKGSTVTTGGLVLWGAAVFVVSCAAAAIFGGGNLPLRAGVAIYAAVMVSNTYMSGRAAAKKCSGFFLTFIGYLLFIISDTILALGLFRGIDFPFRHALVMLTYTLGEGLIVYGICTSVQRSSAENVID